MLDKKDMFPNILAWYTNGTNQYNNMNIYINHGTLLVHYFQMIKYIYL